MVRFVGVQETSHLGFKRRVGTGNEGTARLVQEELPCDSTYNNNNNNKLTNKTTTKNWRMKYVLC